MNSMTKVFFSLAMLMAAASSATAHEAKRALRVVERSEAGVGTLRLTLTHIGEPADAPFHLVLKVRCDGQPEEILIDENVCEYRPHPYDEATTTLTVRASTSVSARGGAAACGKRWAQEFNLRALCGRH
jgi:hypothetical protein